MQVIGLTGSIAMGKTTTARMLRHLRVPVFDADAAVHRLLAAGGAAVAAVLAEFPTVGDALGGIDRRRLGAAVLGSPVALARLEALLHPRVRALERRFLGQARRERRRRVALDIPLLLETGGERRCDAVFVVIAPRVVQTQRVLRRAGMSVATLAAIRARQLPDTIKRRRADRVIPTGLGRRPALRAVVLGLRQIDETPRRRRR